MRCTSLLLNAAATLASKARSPARTDANGVLIVHGPDGCRQQNARAVSTVLSLSPSRPDRGRQKMAYARAHLRRGTSPSVVQALCVMISTPTSTHCCCHRPAMRGQPGACLMALLSWLIATRHPGSARSAEDRMQQHRLPGRSTRRSRETERGDEIGRMAETLEMLRQTAHDGVAAKPSSVESKQQGEQRKRGRADRPRRSISTPPWASLSD